MHSIYLLINGEQKGPYSEEQVRSMYNGGFVTLETQFWREGLSNWQAIDGFFTGKGFSKTPLASVLDETPTAPQPSKITYNQFDDTFSGTTILMVKLAMKSIQILGWKLENANETLGMITFETGRSWGSWSGVSCSLNIEEISENTFQVIGTGKQNIRGKQLLAFDGGEAKKTAQKAIDKMKELALPITEREFFLKEKRKDYIRSKLIKWIIIILAISALVAFLHLHANG